MKPTMWTCLMIAALGFFTHCQKEDRKPHDQQPVSGLRLIGQVVVPYNYQYKNATVGGLSSIDYRKDNNTYYIMSDDPSNQQAARFYTATLDVEANHFSAVNFLHVITLKQPDGTAIAGPATGNSIIVDPEGIAYNPATQTLFWSSEGDRQPEANPPVLIPPFIWEMNQDGEKLAALPLPDLFTPRSTENGPRRNGVFEGLALSPDNKFLFASMEEPLYQDGPRSAASMANTPVRILKFDTQSRNIAAQYAYLLDNVHASPVPANQLQMNGVVEIIPVSDTKLWVMERSFAFGATPSFSVKIYEADMSQATDISDLEALTGASYVPATKRLLLDVGTTGVNWVDNLEGMTLGPTLPNGHATLILVSDNNFNPLQTTQFLAFEVIP